MTAEGGAVGAAPAATISVVVPMYNKGPFVERCLRSIMAQSHAPLEVVVVDDGSRDDGAERARPLLRPCDRLIVQANAGVSAARNLGASLAGGSLVAFLDADDEWEPGFLQAIAALAARWPQLDMFATGYRQFFPGGETVDVTVDAPSADVAVLLGDYFARIVSGPFVWIGCAAFRTSALREIGGFAVGVTHEEDIDLLARMALRSPIGYDRRILSVYRRDVPGSVMRSWQPDPLARTLATVDAALARPGLAAPERRALAGYRAFMWRRKLHDLISAGRWDAIRALRTDAGGPAVRLPTRVAAAVPLARPVLRAIVLAGRVPTSRAWLRLRRGRRRAGGVEMRLARLSGTEPAPTAG